LPTGLVSGVAMALGEGGQQNGHWPALAIGVVARIRMGLDLRLAKYSIALTQASNASASAVRNNFSR